MRVKIVSPVEHDGKALQVGDIANLPEDVAERLIAGRAAEKPASAKAAAGEATPAGDSAGAGSQG